MGVIRPDNNSGALTVHLGQPNTRIYWHRKIILQLRTYKLYHSWNFRTNIWIFPYAAKLTFGMLGKRQRIKSRQKQENDGKTNEIIVSCQGAVGGRDRGTVRVRGGPGGGPGHLEPRPLVAGGGRRLHQHRLQEPLPQDIPGRGDCGARRCHLRPGRLHVRLPVRWGSSVKSMSWISWTVVINDKVKLGPNYLGFRCAFAIHLLCTTAASKWAAVGIIETAPNLWCHQDSSVACSKRYAVIMGGNIT